MFTVRPVWCPNVMLLNPTAEAGFADSEVAKILQCFQSKDPLVFVRIDSMLQPSENARIIIEYDDYTIYRINKSTHKATKENPATNSHIFSYFVHAKPEALKAAVVHFIDILGFDYPIVCFAQGLLEFLSPALIIFKELDPIQKVQLVQQENLSKTLLLELNNIESMDCVYDDSKIVLQNSIFLK